MTTTEWGRGGAAPLLWEDQMTLMSKVTRLFHWIAEPRVQRSAYFVIYALHFVAGVAILFGQPDPFAAAIGEPLTAAWGIFLAFGGLVGAIAVLPGWNYIERIGILSVLVGVALCATVIASTEAHDGTPPGALVAIWALVVGWVAVFLLRVYEIRLYLVAPPVEG